ncbi:MAG TPA: hypothetical protein EYH37_03560, partial [Aquifex aeolicus]|nr:hypothetical protein [Aquifex aeolicus]
MAFRILNNYEADVGLTNLYRNRTKLSKLEQQLSTGLRIVRAADDATDLFIADYLKQTHVGLQRGTQNAQYGLAAARIVDDALGKIYDILVKIKDKIVEAANAHTKDERIQAQQQINEYVRNIAQIVKQTEFDGRRLLAGDFYEVHFGSHKDQYLVINGDDAFGNALTISAKAASNASGAAVLGFNLTAIYGFDVLGGGKYQLNITDNTSFSIVVTSNYANIQSSLANIEKLMTAIDKIRGYYAGIENKLQN